MGDEEVQRIKSIFSLLNLNPIYLEHVAVITSEDASKTRGISLKQGIKALLFTDGHDHWVIVDVPADMKVDQKKVATQLGWAKKDVRMATHEEVMQKTGCQIGAVPPFGHKEKIQILVDSGVYENVESDFNIGLRTLSAKIPTVEMKIVFKHENAIEGNFVKL